MAERSVEIEGLKEFQRALRKLDSDLATEPRKFNKELADDIASDARSRASAMGGVRGRAAGAITGYATAAQASVGFLAASSRYPMASVAFWGAKKHTGWYAHINSNVPQHPRWVGNTWEPGVRSQGPYAINDAVAVEADRIVDRYWVWLEQLARQAFPD